MSAAVNRSCMPLAQELCQGHGLEIGAASYSDFGVEAWNLDLAAAPPAAYRAEQIERGGAVAPVHIVGFAETLPLKNASQDFLLASHVIEHSPNPIATLVEWNRIVRPGGILFLVVPHKDRTPDRIRPRTSLEHVVEDYRTNQTRATHRETDGFLTSSSLHTPHYHAWITLDFLEIVCWMIEQELVAWYLEEIEDIDSNRQDGFTIVLRKDAMPAHRERAGGWVSRRALRSMLSCPEQIGFLRSKALIEDHDLLEVLAGTLIWQDNLIRDRERLIKSHEWQIADLGRQLDEVLAWAHSMEAKLGALQAKLLYVPALSALRGRVERWRPWPKINPQIGQSVEPEQLTSTTLPYEIGRAVAGRMEESDFDQLVAERAGSSDSRRWGSRMVEITGVDLLDRNDHVCDCFHSAEPVTVRMHYAAHESVRDPAFGIAIHYQNGVQVLGLNTVFSEVAIPLITGGGVVSCAFASLSLLAGSYYLTIAVYDTSLIHAYDHQHFATSFTILGDHSAEQYGLVTLPHRWILQIGPENAERSKE